MEMTSRQKDKKGLCRYGINGDDMEVLREEKVAGKPSPMVGGGHSIMVGSYLFTSNDDMATWTGPHLGKPDLDATLKRFSIIPEQIEPIRK